MNARLIAPSSPSSRLRLLAAAPLLVPLAPASAAPPAEVAFAELGQAFLEAHCPEAAGPQDCSLDQVLRADYASLRLGVHELCFPLDFLGGQRRMEVQQLSLAALELQQEWLERFAREPATAAAGAAEIETLRAWIEDWSKADVGRLAKGAGGDLLDLLEADEAVREAAQHFAERPVAAEAMVVAPQYTKKARMVLCPTRLEFMQLVGYTGLVSTDRRAELWQAGVDQWTQFWIDAGTVVVALEYAAWGDDPNFRTGMSMARFDKDGLRQHFVQQAASALLFLTLNRPDMTLFEKGLSVNLTVAVCGRANTIDGEGAISSTGASTAPYERFVPGGNSSGGVLPAIPAAGFDSMLENKWREGGGKDMYVKVLREGQKVGAKKARKDRDNPLHENELAHFELQSSSGKKCIVSAPFLGRLAAEKPYPDPEYLNDYREFFRSYQSCFLSWLEQYGVPDDPEASKARFDALFQAVAAPGGKSLDDAVAEVYSAPLSTVDGSSGLEWRFLAWLATTKG